MDNRHRYYRHRVMRRIMQTPSDPHGASGKWHLLSEWDFSKLNPQDHFENLNAESSNHSERLAENNPGTDYRIFYKIILSHEIEEEDFYKRNYYSIPLNQYIFSFE